MAEYREPFYNTLPDYVRSSGDESKLLQDFCDALQISFEDYFQLRDRLQAIYTVDYTPPDWLDWLGQLVGLAGTPERWLGIGLNPNWSPQQKRRVIKQVAPYWRRKGTLAGIRQAIDLWLQWSKSYDQKFLDFRHPFGRSYRDTPQQWHGWFLPYYAQILQDYKELQYFGSKVVPTPYQPFLYEIQNERDSWRWQEAYHDRIFNRVRVDWHDYAKTGNSPNHMRAHFHLNERDWNTIVPDIHDLNKEIWDATTEPFVFAWQPTLPTEVRLYERQEEPPEQSTFGRQVSYSLDGYNWYERYPRIQDLPSKTIRKQVEWQDHFTSSEGFQDWRGTYGSYRDRILPPETHSKWEKIEIPPKWGSDWHTPYAGERLNTWEQEETYNTTEPTVASYETGWGSPYAHYWKQIENRIYTTTETQQREYLANDFFWDWPSQWHGRRLPLPLQKNKIERTQEFPATAGGGWDSPFGRHQTTKKTRFEKQKRSLVDWSPRGIGWYHPYFWSDRKQVRTKISETITSESIGGTPFCHWGTLYGSKGGISLPVRQQKQFLERHQEGRWGSDWHDPLPIYRSHTVVRQSRQQTQKRLLESKGIDWNAPYIPSQIPPNERFRSKQRQTTIVRYEPHSKGWDGAYLPSQQPEPETQKITETVETISVTGFGSWLDRYMSQGGYPLQPKTWVTFVPHPHYQQNYEKWWHPYTFSGTQTRSWYETNEYLFYVPKAGVQSWLSPYQPAARPRETPQLPMQSSRQYLHIKPQGADWNDSYTVTSTPPPLVEQTQVEIEHIDWEGFATWQTPYGHAGGRILPERQQVNRRQTVSPGVAGGDWHSPYKGTFSFDREVSEEVEEPYLIFHGDRIAWYTPYQPPIRPRHYPTEEVTNYINRVRKTPYTRGWQQAYPYSSQPTIIQQTNTNTIVRIDRDGFGQWGDIYGTKRQLLYVPPERKQVTTEQVQGHVGGDWWDSYLGSGQTVRYVPQTTTEQIWMPIGAAWGSTYPYNPQRSWVEERVPETIEYLDTVPFTFWGTPYGSDRRPLSGANGEYEFVEIPPQWGLDWQDSYFGIGETTVQSSQTVTENIWMPTGAAWGSAYPYSTQQSWFQQTYIETTERIDTAPFGQWNDTYGSRSRPIKAPEMQLVSQNVPGHVGGDWQDGYLGKTQERQQVKTTQDVPVWYATGAAWGGAYPYNPQTTRYQTSHTVEYIDTAPFGQWNDTYGSRSRPIKAPEMQLVSQNVPGHVGGDWQDGYLGAWQTTSTETTTNTITTFENAGFGWTDPYNPTTEPIHDRVWQTRTHQQDSPVFTAWSDVFTRTSPYYRSFSQYLEPEWQERTFSTSSFSRPFRITPLLQETGETSVSTEVLISQQETSTATPWIQNARTLYSYEPTGATQTDDIAASRWHLTYQQKEVLIWQQQQETPDEDWEESWIALLLSGYDTKPTLEHKGDTISQEIITTSWQQQEYPGSKWQQSDREVMEWQVTSRDRSDDIPHARWHQLYLYREFQKTRLVPRSQLSASEWEDAWRPILSAGYESTPTVENTGETSVKTTKQPTTTEYEWVSPTWSTLRQSFWRWNSLPQPYSDRTPYERWHLRYRQEEIVNVERYLESELTASEWNEAWGPLLSTGYEATPIVEDTGEVVEVPHPQKDVVNYNFAGTQWQQNRRTISYVEVQEGTPEYSDDIPHKRWHLKYRSYNKVEVERISIAPQQWQQAWQNKIASGYPPTPVFNYWVATRTPVTQVRSISHNQWLQNYKMLPFATYGGTLEANRQIRSHVRTYLVAGTGSQVGTPYSKQESTYWETVLLPESQRRTPRQIFSRWHQHYQVSIEVRERVIPRSTYQWLQEEWQKVGTPGYSSYPLLGEGDLYNETINTSIAMPTQQWLQQFTTWPVQTYSENPLTIASVATLRTEDVQQTEVVPVSTPATPWVTFDVWYEYVAEEKSGAPRYSSPVAGSIWAQSYQKSTRTRYEVIPPPQNWNQQWRSLASPNWGTPLYDRFDEQGWIWEQVAVHSEEWSRQWRFFYGQTKFANLPIIYKATSTWQEEIVEEEVVETIDIPGQQWQRPARSFVEVVSSEPERETPQIAWTPYHLLYEYREKTVSLSRKMEEISEEQWKQAWLPLASRGYQVHPTLEAHQDYREIAVPVEYWDTIDIPSTKYGQQYEQRTTIEMVPEGDRYTPQVPSRPWYGSPREWWEKHTIQHTSYVSQWQESWRSMVSKGYARIPTVFTVLHPVTKTLRQTYHQHLAFHSEPWTQLGKTRTQRTIVDGEPTIFPKQPYTSWYGMPRSLEGTYEEVEVVTPQKECVPGLEVDTIVGYEPKTLPAIEPYGVPLRAQSIEAKYQEVTVSEKQPGWAGFQWYQEYVGYPPAAVEIAPVPTFTANLEGLGESVYPNASIPSVDIEMPMPYEVASLWIVLSFEEPFQDIFNFKYPYPPFDIKESKPVFQTDSMWSMRPYPEIVETQKVRSSGWEPVPPRTVLLYQGEAYAQGYKWYHGGFGGRPPRSIEIPVFDTIEYCNVPNRYTTLVTEDWKENFYVAPTKKRSLSDRYRLVSEVARTSSWELLVSTSEGVKQIPPICLYVVKGSDIGSDVRGARSDRIDIQQGFDTLYMEFANLMPNRGEIDSIVLWLKGHGCVQFRSFHPKLNYTSKEVSVFPIVVSLQTEFPIVDSKYLQVSPENVRIDTSNLRDWGLDSNTIDLEVEKEDNVFKANF